MNYNRSSRKSVRTTNPSAACGANFRIKRAYRLDGILACEFCGWTAPPGLLGVSVGMRLHHIVPLFADGALEDRSNTALLCPNHAAIGDHLAFQSVDAFGNFSGPKTRAELFVALAQLESGRGKPFVLKMAPKAMEGFGAAEKK